MRIFSARFVIAFFAVSAFISPRAPAQRLTPEDLLKLPEVCRYTWDGPYRDAYDLGFSHFKDYRNHPRYGMLFKYYMHYGEGLITLHHYCRGLKKIDTASQCRTSQCRTYELESAIGEFDYVLINTTEDFILRAEIMLKKAQLLFLNEQDKAAVSTLVELIRGHPEYIPPYLILAEHFNKYGLKSEATALIKNALEIAPGNEELASYLEQLEKENNSKP